jgi:hypothetical protein
MWWGGDIPTVIMCPYQYSSMTAPGDSQLRLWPKENDTQFAAIAKEVDSLTDGTVPVQTDATHYFSLPLTAPPPAWGSVSLVHGGDLGNVKFYRLGLPPSSPSIPNPGNTTLDPSRTQ